MKNLLIFVFVLNLFSCKTDRFLTTVNEVNLEKYAGQWYEIARLPNKFEEGLKCVTATYSLKKNGKIDVLNAGISTEKMGEPSSANGTAWIPNPEFPGRLKVSFFWPFAGNYYIISLDEGYQYALVGDPSRKFLWVLSRTKQLDETIYSKLLEIARQNEFKIEHVIKVEQDCKQ